MVADLLGEGAHLLHHARAGARQADVGRDNPQVGHEVQQPPLDFERRVLDRRRLQPVAQGLVVEIHAGAGPIEAGRPFGPVPVVDQVALVHRQEHTGLAA